MARNYCCEHSVPIELTQLRYKEVDIFTSDAILGKGCYSTMYRARCDQLPCAAKYLDYDAKSVTKEDVVRLEMACQLVCLLRHPSLILCLGTVKHGDVNRPIMLLELMDENLSQFLQRFQQQSLNIPHYTKVNICHDVALGLSYLHLNDIVHGNLSSNNILIIGESRAKITDFWMLKLVEAVPQLEFPRLQGNTDSLKQVYMAPEVIHQNPPVYTQQSDTYSFGVLTLQIENQCPFLPNDDLVKCVEQCKQMIGKESNLMFTPLACKCLKDDQSERADLKTLCYDLSQMKVSREYVTSMEQSRNECENIRQRLMECEQSLVQCTQQIQRKEEELLKKDVIVKEMEQSLLRTSEEKDKLVKKNSEHELFEQWLISSKSSSWIGLSRGHLSPAQDEPDSSTDGDGDNSVLRAAGNDIHHVMQHRGVVISLKDIVVSQEMLGEGEIAKVYSGTWDSKEIAFKKFKLQNDSEEWTTKLKHEAKQLCQLRHPRVVTVYGVTVECGHKGIVMELLTCTLYQALFDEKRRFSEDKRKKIIRQILEGLDFLHSKDVVHCNLTCNNIFLDAHNGAKIGNYGPKFARSRQQYIHDLIGHFEPRYAAPEILQRKPLTREQLKKADIYSTALISYEVMASVHPYTGLPSQLMERQNDSNSPPSSCLDILRRYWEVDSTKRPTSREFLNAWRKLM